MMSMNKAQAGKKVAKKPVAKKKTPHPNDDYKDMVDPATGKKGTMGGEGTIPPFDKNSPVLPLPGRKAKNMPKAKNGKSFPDLNKDGKITKADILKGRGVIAKKGATIKKMQGGGPAKDTTKVSYETSPYTKTKQDNSKKPIEYKKFLLKYQQDEKWIKMKAEKDKKRAGGSIKKAQGGTKFGMLSVKAGVDNNPKPTAADRIAGAKGLAKSGKTMKKCKYGCK